MSRNNDYTTGKLLEHSCHQNYYNPICMELSRQINTTVPQQINFREKSEENEGATIMLITEKQQRTILNIFFSDSLIVTE